MRENLNGLNMRPTRLLFAFLALLGTACATTSAERPASTPRSAAVAEPRAFLWEVTRPDAPDKRLYLTGSVHLGRPGQFLFHIDQPGAFILCDPLHRNACHHGNHLCQGNAPNRDRQDAGGRHSPRERLQT